MTDACPLRPCTACPETAVGQCVSCDADRCDEHLAFSSYSDEYHCSPHCEFIACPTCHHADHLEDCPVRLEEAREYDAELAGDFDRLEVA